MYGLFTTVVFRIIFAAQFLHFVTPEFNIILATFVKSIFPLASDQICFS